MAKMAKIADSILIFLTKDNGKNVGGFLPLSPLKYVAPFLGQFYLVTTSHKNSYPIEIENMLNRYCLLPFFTN